MRAQPFVVAGALVTIGLLGGCSASPGHPFQFVVPEGASQQQLDAIADSVVTDEEYTAGYRAYVACLAEAGYEVVEYGRPDSIFEIGIPDAAVQSGADDTCYNTHFKAVDELWQFANPVWDENGPKLQACLAAAGLPTDGNENELQQRMVDNGLDLMACLGLPPQD